MRSCWQSNLSAVKSSNLTVLAGLPGNKKHGNGPVCSCFARLLDEARIFLDWAYMLLHASYSSWSGLNPKRSSLSSIHAPLLWTSEVIMHISGWHHAKVPWVWRQETTIFQLTSGYLKSTQAISTAICQARLNSSLYCPYWDCLSAWLPFHFSSPLSFIGLISYFSSPDYWFCILDRSDCWLILHLFPRKWHPIPVNIEGDMLIRSQFAIFTQVSNTFDRVQKLIKYVHLYVAPG